MEDFSVEYEEVYEPNIMEIAGYVRIAKGPNRTMAEFAELCGVSASTLSRIANEKVTRRLSVELVQAIVQHAVPQHEFDYESFMRANGMVPKKERTERMNRDAESVIARETKKNLVNIVKNTVWMEWSQKGYPVLYQDPRVIEDLPESMLKKANVFHSISTFAYNCFVLRVQGIEPKYWWYIIDTVHDGSLDRGDQIDFINFPRNEMTDWAPLFLMDAWEPEIMKDVKITFCFVDAEIFDRFVELMKQAKLNTPITIQLIDTENQTVSQIYEVMK